MTENGAGAPAKLKKGSKPEKLLAFIRLQSDADGVLELPSGTKQRLMKRLKYSAEPNVNRDLRILASRGLIRYEKTLERGRWSKVTIIHSPEFTRRRLASARDMAAAIPLMENLERVRAITDEIYRKINLALEAM